MLARWCAAALAARRPYLVFFPFARRSEEDHVPRALTPLPFVSFVIFLSPLPLYPIHTSTLTHSFHHRTLPAPTRPGHALHARLLSWFLDAPAVPFGVHRMELAEQKLNNIRFSDMP
ncbi:hypothetical protein B0H13DRAFT_2355057 [Mycena leptocephala]|nr:hypothetical protein B0H13DRAFT_2355057 [Mycena leptocephala]